MTAPTDTGVRVAGEVRRDHFSLSADLAVGPGEVVAVVGPNGAGKSTLLRAIAGLEPLHSGRVTIGGRVVDDADTGALVPPHRRGVGVVFQDYRLFPHLTVLDNVAFGLRSNGASRRESREAAARWCERYELGELVGRRPSQLSGGQQQRVALARALCIEPAALLLDEPLAALDAGTRGEVRSQLRVHLRREGKPTLLVTHDPLDALALADRIVVLEGGRITQEGTAIDVARRPATAYVARLLGLNLLRGTASGGTVELDGGGAVQVTDTALAGPVWVTLRPDAISLFDERPHGSARNVWQGRVVDVEPIGDRVRVSVVGPPSVMCDVTAGAVHDMGIASGTVLWLAAKATELDVYPGDLG